MSEIISWPIGPLEGDQYSVNGKFWEWNGCAWISTCCPGVCSIYETGIILGITIEGKWGPNGTGKEQITTKICFKYDEQTGTWNSESIDGQGDYYQMLPKQTGTAWSLNLMRLGVKQSQLGEISGTTPIGNWNWEDKNQKAESICGCPPMICGCVLNDVNSECEYVSFFPVSLTGVSGATVGYIDIFKKWYIYYNTTALQWELYSGNFNTPLLATISLPITTVPIGPDIEDWTLTPTGEGSFDAFSTELGHCHPCNEYTDGIILAYTVNGIITYVPLTWNATTDRFENNDGTIYIELNAATNSWNLWINGSLVYSHKNDKTGILLDLLGFWSKEITILCGTTLVTNTEGCLVAVSGGEAAATLYLQENTFGEFNYGYPFSQPTWQIVCDGGVWSIQEWDDNISAWVTQAFVTAPCTAPPYSLAWTVTPTSNYDSFTFTAGPCPTVCNSYTFSSSNPDGTTISFKLCGCDNLFILRIGGGVSDTYCVQEDSIDLGAFGIKELVSSSCEPDPNQCYSIVLMNSSQEESNAAFLNCAGAPSGVSVPVGEDTVICGRPCTINVSNGSFDFYMNFYMISTPCS